MQIRTSVGVIRKPRLNARIFRYDDGRPYLSVDINAREGGASTHMALELDDVQDITNLLIAHVDDLLCAVAEHEASDAATPRAASDEDAGAAVTPVAAAPVPDEAAS
ncbi:MAG TPA: hypothetical protein VFH54_12650 [Mycobacteriales bacterium]|nr:hypothetical protein [Mycobacteriales bacterium]